MSHMSINPLWSIHIHMVYITHQYPVKPQIIYLTQLNMFTFDLKLKLIKTYIENHKLYIIDSFCKLNQETRWTMTNGMIILNCFVCDYCAFWVLGLFVYYGVLLYRIDYAECNACDCEACTIINDYKKKASVTNSISYYFLCICSCFICILISNCWPWDIIKVERLREINIFFS